MATLHDRRGHYSLEIQPLLPSLEGPHNAYNVFLREREQVLFQRQYTTYYGTGDGHWYVWRLIRALRAAPALVNAKTEFNLSASGSDEFREGVTLYESTGWLSVILSGDTIVHRRNQPQPWRETRLFVELALLTGPQLSGHEAPPLQSYVHFGLTCQPEAVEKFGTELLDECRAALRRRRELGTPASADDYIDDGD